MAFWKKGESEKKKEMEALKREVEGKREEEEGLPILPESLKKMKSPKAERLPELQPPLPKLPRQAPKIEERPFRPMTLKTAGYAPLFVKIDRYRDVLKKMQEIKGALNYFEELLNLMTQVDQIKSEGMEMLRQGITEVINTILALDEEFIRPEGFSGIEEVAFPEATPMRDYITDLQSELDHLKKELKGI
jgi:hypothetical protein